MGKEKTTLPEPKEKKLTLYNKIANQIFLVRGKKVMLDKDLAKLYGVETRVLNQAVKRNTERFPKDFMFQLTKKEMESLRSQFVISSWGGRRYAAYAFTEHGVAMLSSILNSKRAIQVNIQIMRAFAKFREMLMAHKDLKLKIEALEKESNYKFQKVFEILRELQRPLLENQKKIEGFSQRKNKLGE